MNSWNPSWLCNSKVVLGDPQTCKCSLKWIKSWGLSTLKYVSVKGPFLFLLKPFITFLFLLVQDKHQTWNLTIVILGDFGVNLSESKFFHEENSMKFNKIQCNSNINFNEALPELRCLKRFLKEGDLDASWGFLGSVRLSKEHLCSFINTHYLAE